MSTLSQNLIARAKTFQQLHQSGLFVLPNPWDVGSAKMLAALGFQALATTSAGFAFARGRPDRIDDNDSDRDAMLAHAAEIIAATSLPVSADLENGYGDTPQAVAETVRRAVEIGLAGCTIEDTSGDPQKPIYDKTLAVERIAAGTEAAAAAGRPFMLTARAENYLHGRPDLDDTIARLRGYESVGAPVVYAPGLPDLGAIREVCNAVSVPVNVVAGIAVKGMNLEDLQSCGVRRVSFGSALARTVIGALINAATEIREQGTFTAFESAAAFKDIEKLLSEPH